MFAADSLSRWWFNGFLGGASAWKKPSLEEYILLLPLSLYPWFPAFLVVCCIHRFHRSQNSIILILSAWSHICSEPFAWASTTPISVLLLLHFFCSLTLDFSGKSQNPKVSPLYPPLPVQRRGEKYTLIPPLEPWHVGPKASKSPSQNPLF